MTIRFANTAYFAAMLATTACATAPDLPDLAACNAPFGSLRLNDVQSIGSHNSYKLAIPDAELDLIRLQSPELADSLDYSHLTLTEQLDLGMRQLELDVFHDPEGGRFANPLLPRLVAAQGSEETFDASDHDQPGLKVMHVQDVDQRSNCVLFTGCLEEIKAWSEANPKHTPIFILINTKQAQIELPGATKALPFDGVAFDGLDAEVRSVFSDEHLITPDDMRGDAASLRDSLLSAGWPTLTEARGKILLALDEAPEVVETYLRGRTSLEGLPLFVNTIDPAADHAAYFTINDPKAEGDRIKAAVADGFLVRTRADADTVEARTEDSSRLEAALASGAQYISTDYYLPREEFGKYTAALPGGAVTRCRP
ncbi:MAG: phosphatidylinositol-specific phospholipase C1-like protein [Pseudomonadota bacterium]